MPRPARCRHLVLISTIGMALWGSLGTPSFGAVVTHGPVVGAVTPSSSRLLVRTDGAAAVAFDLSSADPSFAAPIRTPTVSALPGRDFFAISDATGLTPNTLYYYRVVLDDIPGPLVGSFWTFPDEGDETEFTFAFGACQQAGSQDQTSGEGGVWNRVVEAQPRFFLQLGDWGYPDTTETATNPDDFFNRDYARVQASYRSKYDPTYPMSSLLAVAPIDYVYDDHDYSNDNADGTAPDKQNSVRGYQEMFPHYPLAEGSSPSSLHHRFHYGNAEFFFVDTRTLRDPNANAFPNHQEWLDAPETRLRYASDDSHRLLGDAQRQWLIDSLLQSTATWKFLVTGVPFNSGHRASLELALSLQNTEFDQLPGPDGPIAAAEIALQFADGWTGFPNSVEGLIAPLAQAGIQNLIVLSGDSHTAGVDDGANSLLPEFMAGGLDRSNSRLVALQELFGVFTWNVGGQGASQSNFNDHFGKVTVRAEDVQIDIFDFDGELIVTHIVPKGTPVQSTGLSVAPLGYQFTVDDCTMPSTRPVFLINTAAAAVTISDLTLPAYPFEVIGLTETAGGYAADPTLVIPFDIAPGEKRILGVVFAPSEEGVFSETLTVMSNDPDGDVVIALNGGSSCEIVSVAISGLSAVAGSDGVELAWQSADPRVDSYAVARKREGGTWIELGLVRPRSTGNVRFIDAADEIRNGEWLTYRVGAERMGAPTVFAQAELQFRRDGLVGRPHLRPNFPNPFNPSTSISFDLPQKSPVTLQIFNVGGQRVDTLADETLGPGLHTFHWDGTDAGGKPLASGIYVYRLSTRRFVQSRKMLLAK